MPNVLVTGAGGFIGSHLVEMLVSKGDSVRAMVRYNSKNSWGWLESLPSECLKSINILSSDIRDPFAVSEAVKGVDVVYHLAALIGIPYSYVAPSSYVDTNLNGTLNVLQACLDHGKIRVIHTSTSETYGTAQYTPMDETHPLVGQSPYSASKIAADKMAQAYHLSFGLPVTTIRPFNTYGPRQSARAVIPTIVSQALSGVKEIKLGSLSPVRDLTFVEDTAKGFVAAAFSNNTIGKTLNLGQGSGISIGELAKTILSECDVDKKIVHDQKRIRPDASEVLELISDNSEMLKLTGWKPDIILSEGIRNTVEWMKENIHHFKAAVYNI